MPLVSSGISSGRYAPSVLASGKQINVAAVRAGNARKQCADVVALPLGSHRGVQVKSLNLCITQKTEGWSVQSALGLDIDLLGLLLVPGVFTQQYVRGLVSDRHSDTSTGQASLLCSNCPELVTSEDAPNPWCQTILLVLLANHERSHKQACTWAPSSDEFKYKNANHSTPAPAKPTGSAYNIFKDKATTTTTRSGVTMGYPYAYGTWSSEVSCLSTHACPHNIVAKIARPIEMTAA